MHFIDPLFQRVLVRECQSRKIPVIFDEVFTGFWRLGAEVGCLYNYVCCSLSVILSMRFDWNLNLFHAVCS